MNNEYQRWLSKEDLDESLKKDLDNIKDNYEEIEKRFSSPMQFGTAGLRSIMGAGIYYMNIYTVAQTTKALADLIIQENGCQKGVAISYDSRNNSKLFAETSACVLAANNIKVYLFDDIRPTPELSFAILHLGCIAGINITASHNPKEYNGYKVYWSDGAQLPPEHAKKISDKTAATDIFSVKQEDYITAVNNGLINIIGKEIDDSYLNAVLECSLNPEVIKKYGNQLNLVFTPIHGTGYKLVPEVLCRAGLTNLRTVAEQNEPDGNFPTVESPNPENRACFDMATELINKNNLNTDVVIATDPDGDRLGVAVKDNNGIFIALSGNQIGALLINYIIAARRISGRLPANACGIRSIVSSNLFDEICIKNNVKPVHVLTGFKYIGEKIKEYKINNKHTFIFGYEESQGFLSGVYARDKDAVAASLLITEAACFYKQEGKSLYNVLLDIYNEYGYYDELVVNINIEDVNPMKAMAEKMKTLRTTDIMRIGDKAVTERRDYSSSVITNLITNEVTSTELPKSDMLFFILEDKTTIIVRPSGTEPKIKYYIQCCGTSLDDVESKLKHYKEEIKYM
ncbi:phospho-sugar mutase [Eubacteriales bacterium OttesenSCG-928-G02]|nr:phospho-sugar mutase [Eubacteriales bacterium OttesenSCG-928-G02]